MTVAAFSTDKASDGISLDDATPRIAEGILQDVPDLCVEEGAEPSIDLCSEQSPLPSAPATRPTTPKHLECHHCNGSGFLHAFSGKRPCGHCSGRGQRVYSEEEQVALTRKNSTYSKAELQEFDDGKHPFFEGNEKIQTGRPAMIGGIKLPTPVARVRSPVAISVLTREFEVITREFQSICQVELASRDIFYWEVSVIGPTDTPYQGGYFRFLFAFPAEYPERPPRIRCTTPVYHCNIDANGTVCLDFLDEQAWRGLTPRLNSTDIIQALMSLLIFPVPENALCAHVAQLFVSDRRKHDVTARLWTLEHAS